MKTIDIKGTPYVTVNSRLTYFRENYKDYRLVTEIVSNDNGGCLIKASVVNEKGEVLATGHAYEKEGVGFINKTSHVENCETSAWGRALGNFGIGIDAAVASYEEVANAIEQRKPTKTKKEKESAHAETATIKKEDIEKMVFEDIHTQPELSRTWIDLSKEQQKDKDIKNWFTVRKLQLKGE